MCKVLKDYGIVADHGSKVLKLQKIKDGDDNKLALVSYKDGMGMGYYDLPKDEAKQLYDLLTGYLNYKPVTETETETEEDTELFEATETKRGIIHSLTSLPTGDCSYYTTLEKATREDIEQAIAIMQKGGRNATRIKVCENALKRLDATTKTVEKVENKADTKAETKVGKAKAEPKKEEPKIVTFPTEDKKPKIIKLEHIDEDRTYGECVVKLKKEAEMFTDSDSQYVIEGLLEYAKADPDFRNCLMREDKTYGGFMEYMFKAAQNGYCVKYGNVGWLDRDLGLGLAIDYFYADCDKMKAEEEAKRKAEAEQKKKTTEAKKKGASKNGKNVGKKKGRTTA